MLKFIQIGSLANFLVSNIANSKQKQFTKKFFFFLIFNANYVNICVIFIGLYKCCNKKKEFYIIF